MPCINLSVPNHIRKMNVFLVLSIEDLYGKFTRSIILCLVILISKFKPTFTTAHPAGLVFLFDLILNVHSTIFQLCGTGLPGLNQY